MAVNSVRLGTLTEAVRDYREIKLIKLPLGIKNLLLTFSVLTEECLF